MSVRTATGADIERLVDLNMEVHDYHVAHLPYFFKTANREDLAAYFREVLGREDARVFVATDGATVAGYVLLVIRERPENPIAYAQRWLYVEQIGVSTAHRRQGHGAALIAAARQMAREQGLDRIELHTWAFNEPAHAFFHAQGFETRGLQMAMEL